MNPEQISSTDKHSHGCNCDDIRKEWFSDWFDKSCNMVKRPIHTVLHFESDLQECTNFSKFLRKKQYLQKRGYNLSFRILAGEIHRFASRKVYVPGDPDHRGGFKTPLVQAIVQVLSWPQEDDARLNKFEKKIDSLCNPRDGSLDLTFYHENGHWSPDCHACRIEHDTQRDCQCKICAGN